MQPFNIRLFKSEDADQIILFAREFWNKPDFNEDFCRKYLTKISELGIVLIAEDGNKMIGVILAFESENHFTGAKVLYRSDVFVDKNHRNKGVCKALQVRLKEIGETVGFDEYSWEMERL